MLRSTCDSAAKWTTAVQPRMASSTAAASQISPRTNEVIRIVRDRLQIRQIPGIGQLVVIDDLSSPC